MSKVLIVLTSHDRLGNTGDKTGFWLEEFAAPYYILKDAGLEVTLASPKGGQPPLDPRSDDPESETESMRRFKRKFAFLPHRVDWTPGEAPQPVTYRNAA